MTTDMTNSAESDGMQTATHLLRTVWGYDAFRPLQADAVASVIAGRDSLIVLPTGGGKSLCYQIPAMVRDGLAIVVSPLISLMKDQVDALLANGVAAALINSTQSDEEKRVVADSIRAGKLDLLYMSPEGLLVPRTLAFLQQARVSFFAIDEAHCVSNWGHDFRPEYRELSVLKDRFPDASIHAFTATASARVRRDIAQQLELEDPLVLVGDFDRPNLTYRMPAADRKLDQIRAVIRRHPGSSGIVYCISRREVEQTAAALQASGISAEAYHAGLDDATRTAQQDAFIKEQIDVIVATVAFGMGIDKSNVRYVVHAGMPKSIEHYQQESGRAGRDGLASECVLLHSGGDVMTWKRIFELGDTANLDASMRSINAMAELCRGVRCRHAALVEYFGQEYDSENCNACDVCLNEIDIIDDAVTVAQKILSCVVRLKERFGAGYTVKVLTGSRDARILELGHDHLSTYGLLQTEGASATRMWIDQLVSQGFLNRVGDYQTLQLSDSGRKLMRREASVTLSRPAKRPTTSDRDGTSDDWSGVDRGLFEQLRALRRQLAADRDVPAYVIFGDAVLRDLARVQPSNMNAMRQIKGVGEKKLESFGPIFLSSIQEHASR